MSTTSTAEEDVPVSVDDAAGDNGVGNEPEAQAQTDSEGSGAEAPVTPEVGDAETTSSEKSETSQSPSEAPSLEDDVASLVAGDKATKAETKQPKEAEKPAEERDPYQVALSKVKDPIARRHLDKALKELTAAKEVVARDSEIAAFAKEQGFSDHKEVVAGFKDFLKQEAFLRRASPERQAAYFRKIAEQLDPVGSAPEPVVLSLPKELSDAVEAGIITQERAAELAKIEATTKLRAERATKAIPAPAAPSPEQAAYADAATKAQTELGHMESGYKARFGAEWGAMLKTLTPQLEAKFKTVHPSAWPSIAESMVEALVAKRVVPPKRPEPTTRPTGAAPKVTGKIPTIEADVEALVNGEI